MRKNTNFETELPWQLKLALMGVAAVAAAKLPRASRFQSGLCLGSY